MLRRYWCQFSQHLLGSESGCIFYPVWDTPSLCPPPLQDMSHGSYCFRGANMEKSVMLHHSHFPSMLQAGFAQGGKDGTGRMGGGETHGPGDQQTEMNISPGTCLSRGSAAWAHCCPDEPRTGGFGCCYDGNGVSPGTPRPFVRF